MNREEIRGIFQDAGEEQIDAVLALMEAEVQPLMQQIEQMAAENLLREEQQAAQQRRTALENRFEKAVGGRRFVHDLVRKSVMEEFFAMAEDPANAGRGDSEMLAQITKDQGVFAERYPLMMGPVGGVSTEDLDRLTDAEYYAAFRGM